MATLPISTHQITPQALAFIHEKLGQETFDTIAPYSFADDDHSDPRPLSPYDLPEDAVKAVFADGRPCIGLRYITATTNDIAVEFIYQSHNRAYPWPPSPSVSIPISINGRPVTPKERIDGTVHDMVDCSDVSEEVYARFWTSCTAYTANPICKYYKTVTDEEFKIIKNLLEGKSLEETGGRYLPKYAARFSTISMKSAGL